MDPPYNTGDGSWRYNNKYVDGDDSYRHSKWISMMYKRLRLAKPLLKKDGLMCIMIDNNEVHNLVHIIEEIFPDKEIIITVVEHNLRGKRGHNFALTHEYAVWVVSRGRDLITRTQELGSDVKRNLRKTGGDPNRTDAPGMFYGIEVDKESLEIIGVTEPLPLEEPVPKHTNPDTEMVWPIDGDGNERRWYYGRRRIMEDAGSGGVFAKRIRGSIQIHYYEPGKRMRRKSVWAGPTYDASTYGTELLTEIIGKNDFPYPKSIHAVKECILSMSDDKDAVILDFFAGSGTTGHAVLDLNRDDGGHRKFILCTDNENDICTKVCYPRLKKVIQGYAFEGRYRKLIHKWKITLPMLKNSKTLFEKIQNAKDANPGHKFDTKIEAGLVRLYGTRMIRGRKDGLGGDLRYFKTGFISADSTDQNKRKIVGESTGILCLKEGCFEPVAEGNAFRIFRGYGDRHLGIIYYYDGIAPFKAEASKLGKRISTYVFSFGDVMDEDFAGMDLVDLKPVPSALLSTYRRIFND
ncbi:MAG: site-specific DNA-methyltransferase [Nitrosopumilus sp.]|nr:site-specific DNA-methyltransferase [Nitrosopumilus sp.]